MKNYGFILIALISMLSLTSCSENYSNGERIGYLTRFSEKGLIWKSWEGDLNVTQTGMNTSAIFSFSVDNDKDDKALVAKLDSAASLGWKVKIVYHELRGFNWLSNRGHTDFFVNDVVVLSKASPNLNTSLGSSDNSTASVTGRVIDTIYVVICKECPQSTLQKK